MREKRVFVKGYTRSDGVRIEPHYRTVNVGDEGDAAELKSSLGDPVADRNMEDEMDAYSDPGYDYVAPDSEEVVLRGTSFKVGAMLTNRSRDGILAIDGTGGSGTIVATGGVVELHGGRVTGHLVAEDSTIRSTNVLSDGQLDVKKADLYDVKVGDGSWATIKEVDVNSATFDGSCLLVNRSTRPSEKPPFVSSINVFAPKGEISSLISMGNESSLERSSVSLGDNSSLILGDSVKLRNLDIDVPDYHEATIRSPFGDDRAYYITDARSLGPIHNGHSDFVVIGCGDRSDKDKVRLHIGTEIHTYQRGGDGSWEWVSSDDPYIIDDTVGKELVDYAERYDRMRGQQ